MKCPVCSKQLSEINAGSVMLDACTTGCGGLWFDAGELDKIDQGSEKASEIALRPISNASVVIDRAKPRACPRCPNSTLERQYLNQNFDFEIDLCNTCHGVWTDMGELPAIRQSNDSRAQANEIFDDFKRRALSTSDAKFKKRVEAVFKLLF